MLNTTISSDSIDQLAERIALRVAELSNLRSNQKQAEKYLSRRQLSELLSVDLATLHRWSKNGDLPSYRLRGRVYYKMSDVESKMLQVPNLKDGRA